MKITKIEIDNFRLLKRFAVDLQDNLSLVVGKNNTGKTSLLSLLEKFLKTERRDVFSFNDFCLSLRKDIALLTDETKSHEEIGINLRIFIQYDDKDNLKNIPILDLGPTRNTLILLFKYSIDQNSIIKLQKDFAEYKKQHKNGKDVLYFLQKNHTNYFSRVITAVDPLDTANTIELDLKTVRRIINFQTIGAKRGVANGDGEEAKNNSALSKLSHSYFKNTDDPGATDRIELQNALLDADDKLSTAYASTFKDVTESIKKFSHDATKVKIKSTLESVSLLRDNTAIVYEEDDCDLPEDYNGLGYMNLFAILFRLHIVFDDFKKINAPLEEPADINLLFIEEPEAHTHPQMQYVFVKNIKRLLNEQRSNLANLQTIITTHSSHIVSQADFNDIKYFVRRADKNIEAKNLSSLEVGDGASDSEKRNFKFLKQYLTVHKAELFFADKIIFIEGDTERILLPAMMIKLDAANKSNKSYTPLLSQNISVVDVGANSQTFESFLAFLETKTLVITDLDSVAYKDSKSGKGKSWQAEQVKSATATSNASIKFFLADKSFEELKSLPENDRIRSREESNWAKNKDGQLYVASQVEEGGYHARSFEDAFLAINLSFIRSHESDFESLKNIGNLANTPPDYFALADGCINNKASFAMDVLLFSDDAFADWHIPEYIQKGLTWLGKQ